MAKSWKEGSATFQRRSEVRRSQAQNLVPARTFRWESSLKSTFPPVSCVHKINSSERCIGWLYICLTCERCNMRSIIKRSTRVVGTFKNTSLKNNCCHRSKGGSESFLSGAFFASTDESESRWFVRRLVLGIISWMSFELRMAPFSSFTTTVDKRH